MMSEILPPDPALEIDRYLCTVVKTGCRFAGRSSGATPQRWATGCCPSFRGCG